MRQHRQKFRLPLNHRFSLILQVLRPHGCHYKLFIGLTQLANKLVGNFVVFQSGHIVSAFMIRRPFSKPLNGFTL